MGAPDKPRQIPLDLGHRPGHSRDELVVSDANRQAIALIDAWQVRGVSFDEAFRVAMRGAAQVLSGNGQPK